MFKRRLFLSLILIAIPASADVLQVEVSGQFSAFSGQTDFGASNATWALTFDVDSQPIPTDSGLDGFTATGSNLEYDLNGQAVDASFAAVQPLLFNTPVTEGGFKVSLQDSDGSTANFSFEAQQLFSGATSAPEILTGTFTVTDSSVQGPHFAAPLNATSITITDLSATPEPPTGILMGTVLAGAVFLSKRRKRLVARPQLIKKEERKEEAMKKPISQIQARSNFWLPLIVMLSKTERLTLKLGEKTLKTCAVTLLLSFAGTTSAHADMLDLSGVTKGPAGSFTGTLDGTTVNGYISATTPNFYFDPAVLTDPNYPDSTIDETSPQYSYSNIYAVTAPLADQVGYISYDGTYNPATITINFGSAILDPIFQVANLDGMQYDFSPTVGLSSLKLLSGNGGHGDGILVSGDVISDANPTTVVAQAPSAEPLTSGDRSAYGSVELVGSFTSLTIDVSNYNMEGDGGSFTLATSPTPEPAPAMLFAAMCGILAILMRRARATGSATDSLPLLRQRSLTALQFPWSSAVPKSPAFRRSS
jgi:hypothetical protein